MPAPRNAVLLLTTVCVTLSMPWLKMPPPERFAVLLTRLLLKISVGPLAQMPPPSKLVALLSRNSVRNNARLARL